MKKELDQYPYTLGDKIVCVGLSLWSWPSAAASGIVYILESDLIDFDKPAKW